VGYLHGVRRVAGVFLIAVLSGCSSGGGDEPNRSTQTSVSTNYIELAVDAPDAPTPDTQVVTATFGDDVAHLAVIHNGLGLEEVTSQISGRTAQITIKPAAPSSLGSGIFPGSVAVTGYFCANPACSSLAAGNTQTITVRYQVAPVIQSIAPYVGFESISGEAIVRGVGFQAFNTQGVRLGQTAATEFSIASDTDLRVTYPALPAGTYEVQIDLPEFQGTLQSSARLVIVPPTSYTAEALAYPTANPTVQRIVYDTERSAILVAAQDGTLMRFAYANGAWTAPTTTSVASLQDISLSTQGDTLLVLTSSNLVVADPVTLATIETISTTELDSGVSFKNIATTNEDRAFITTEQSTSGNTNVFLYNGRTRTLVETSQVLNNSTPAASGQGSSVLFVQGHPSLNSAPPVYLFSTVNAQFQTLGTTINQNAIPPVVDRRAQRAVLNGARVHGTTDTASFDLLGTLPAGTLGAAINPEGTRVYTYEAGGIQTFDVSVDRDGAAYTALGAATAVPGDPGANLKMTISPDGRTLFLAGSTQLIVVPTPAL
jgi:hypothetical protein